MNVLAFAWRSLVRQPARSLLGVLGVAAVGALLFDMLMLSDGLVLSMRELLERTGWDVRVTATGDLPGEGPRIPHASGVVDAVSRLPEVRATIALRFADARIEPPGRAPLPAALQGVSGDARSPWTVVRGRDVEGRGEVVVGDTLAEAAALAPGDRVTLRASCRAGAESPPPLEVLVVGIAEFPFEVTGEHTLAGRQDTVADACGGEGADDADLILVASAGDADAAAAAVRAARPDVAAVTNEQLLGRFQETGFTYFRQISTVLTAVTLSFGLLLITVLLTVSVNQRIGELAALRALGFSRARVVADVLCESALIVGVGGLLSLPIGALMAGWLDRILKRMPGLPTEMHFFVFEPASLTTHLLLLATTALVAALYPMQVVARLPIAATLRDEVIS